MKFLLKKTKIIGLLVLLISFLGCEEDDEGNVLPAVVSGFTQTIVENTGTVRFLNISENADSFAWDFGDGTTSTEISPIKIFENGTFTVTLTASNVAGATDVFEDQITISIPEQVALPITFDNAQVSYDATIFGGAAFAVVANPAPGGSNNVESQVGEITNSGAAFEGIFFDLGAPLDLSEDKTVQMNFWSETAVDVLMKLEAGTGADVEVSTAHGGTGWELISFDFTSDASFARLTLFVDGPGTTAGTFYIDDVEQVATADPGFDDGLLTNGDFENGGEGWIGNGLNVVTENGNSFNQVNVETAGNPFDVNLSQVVEIVQGTNYILTFDASSDVARTMLAGIGLNEAPFTNDSQSVNLTTETQTFSLQLSAADFGGANSRILFDMGAETGLVTIDNVSLVVDDNTGGFDSGLLTNGDFENGAAPWIQGVDDNNPAPLGSENGNTFYSVDVMAAGNAFDVNLSQKLEIVQGETYTLTFDAWSNVSRSVIAGIGLSGGDFSNTTETIAITTERQTYTAVLTAAGFGAPDARVLFDSGAEIGIVNIDNVSLVLGNTGGGDTVAPVITLNGDATINLTVGDTFTDPGATATDDVDGDISANIVVGGDTVDTDTAGTYTITYDVSDAAGNAAAQVTRTVNVEAAFDDGLLTNGDFENGAAPWIQGVDDNSPAPVVTENGNSFYSVNITSPDPGAPFAVNLSQKLEIIPNETYMLTFDAWSDTNRSIIAGIGLSGGDFSNTSETVNITDTRATYMLTLTANGFGDATSRVLFDVNGEAGLVNIDNVSLVIDGGGGSGDTVAPVITLNGDATVNLTVGDSFTDPGATATDDVDGDISANIVVGGDMVDTNTAATYTITYDVSDAAGNAAAQVTRTVIVEAAFDDGLLTNGDFENGAAPWIQGVDDNNPAPVVTENGNSFYSVNITSPDPGAPFAVNLSQKLEIIPNETYVLTFDAWSDTNRGIIAGIGLSGGDFSNNSETVNITATRATYMLTLTANGFGDATSRVLFDVNGEAGLVNIDDVSLVIDSGGGSGGGSGSSGIATNGDFETGDDTGWMLFQNGGTATIDNSLSNGGMWSGRLTVGDTGGNPAFKQERIGAGTVAAGDTVQIQFDHIGSIMQPGAAVNVILFGESPGGVTFTEVLSPGPVLGGSWTTYTGSYTIPGGTDVSDGVSILIETVCGAVAGCSVTMNIDNVSVTLNP
ncbi:immunoglobulin-like domain-containing protein [Flagellimonas sp. DF-77]|uniref:immunoglobulin-like domain-containing protein n=1 Tax=Flagellimonas algarum TaxID=3230298 RepID=UPI00339096EA